MERTVTERWEYRTEIVWADAEDPQAKAQLGSAWPDGRAPKYSPMALVPELNAHGAQGWELVHMEPVYLGKHHDVLLDGDLSNKWTHAYFCAFKRRLAD
jgi:hypothetical protein